MMSDLEIRPVRTRRERRAFLTFPWHVYRDDPLWVPPLLPERARTIDPARGAFFRRGEAAFFVAWREGRPVGTLCAGEDRFANAQRGTRESIFGFLEYVEDYAVFEALIEQALAWARERDLEALRGPFNLDYEDGYGVLIEGRDRPPALLCGHTPPYYQTFMERYGFQPARGDNLAYAFDLGVDRPSLQRLDRLAKRIRRRSDFTIRAADMVHWEAELDRIHRLLNRALAHLPDHTDWHRDAVHASLAPFRDIADPELVLFAEAGEETVGWFPGVPNLNEAFIHAGGLRRPWDYVKLWWHMRRQPACLAVKSVLVLPEYWGSGVSVLLFDELVKRAARKGYRWLDLSLTSADNPNTPVLAQRMGARLYKRYRVYRLDLQ
jgi:GNAT superfamily N-acetyltransferase